MLRIEVECDTIFSMSEEEKMVEIERLTKEILKHHEKTTLFMETAQFLNKDMARISKEMDSPSLTSEQVDRLLVELRCIERKFQCEKRMLEKDDAQLAILKKQLNEL